MPTEAIFTGQARTEPLTKMTSFSMTSTVSSPSSGPATTSQPKVGPAIRLGPGRISAPVKAVTPQMGPTPSDVRSQPVAASSGWGWGWAIVGLVGLGLAAKYAR